MTKNKYTPGFADAEKAFEAVEAREKKLRRKEWLQKHKEDKTPKMKGGDNK